MASVKGSIILQVKKQSDLNQLLNTDSFKSNCDHLKSIDIFGNADKLIEEIANKKFFTYEEIQQNLDDIISLKMKYSSLILRKHSTLSARNNQCSVK